MSGAASTLPDAMIDLVDRLIDAADRRGWRRRGKSAVGLRDAGAELVLARGKLIAALDVPAAWRDVAIERRRQIEAEGWSPAHDDRHDRFELASAGAAYAIHAAYRDRDQVAPDAPPAHWPWSRAWWKPADRRRDLIKAAALILAEIERIDRAAACEAAPPDPVPSDPTPLPPQAAAAIAAARTAD